MTPREVVATVARGEGPRLLSSPALWRCLRCLACDDACPRRVNPASVIDELRAEAFRRNVAPEDAPSRAQYRLHRRVLRDIERSGRIDACRLITARDIAGNDRAIAFDKLVALLFKGKLAIGRALARRLAPAAANRKRRNR